jgi:penicillin amidase
MRKLPPKVFRGTEGAVMTGRASVAVMFRMLQKLPEAERSALLLATIQEAAAEAGSRTWGELHKAAFNHPVSAQFNLPSVSRGGDATTPNATSPNMAWVQTSGASFREVLDLADWDRSQAINVPGQSGVPGSAHYGDLLPLWGEGRYFPLLYSRPAIEAASKERLRLVPAPAK